MKTATAVPIKMSAAQQSPAPIDGEYASIKSATICSKIETVKKMARIIS